MAPYPVNDSQLAVYLTFTFLSIVVSIVVYCVYQHSCSFKTLDVDSYISFYVSVSKDKKGVMSDDETDKSANKERLLY